MDEHWFDEREQLSNGEKGKYLNFEPHFTDDGWLLRSTKTGKTYYPSDFLSSYLKDKENPVYSSYYDEYHENLQVARYYGVAPTFMFHWLKMMLMYESLEYREDKRLGYLATNPTKDLLPKEATKVLKKSEKVYQDSYSEFFERFRDY